MKTLYVEGPATHSEALSHASASVRAQAKH